MHVTSKSGRVFRVPSAAEDARIVAGIAADPDACEPSAAALKTLRPVGRPKAPSTKKLNHGEAVGAASVGVADVRGEELQEAEPCQVPSGLHHGGQDRQRREGDKLGRWDLGGLGAPAPISDSSLADHRAAAPRDNDQHVMYCL